MLYHLIYISRTDRRWTSEELFHLLHSAWKINKLNGISGMLIYLGGMFIQLLEGKKEAVTETYQRILKDARHHNVSKVLEGNSEKPLFKEWCMGFKKLDTDEFEDMTGYRDPTAFFTDDTINNHSHPALIFLKLFYDKNYRDFEKELG